MPWPQRLNDNKGHNIIVPNGSDDVRRPMMMTDYTQLLILFLYCTDFG